MFQSARPIPSQGSLAKVLDFQSALQLLADAHERELGALRASLENDLDEMRTRVASYETASAEAPSGLVPSPHPAGYTPTQATANAGDVMRTPSQVSAKSPVSGTNETGQNRAQPDFSPPPVEAIQISSSAKTFEGSGTFGWVNFMRQNLDRSHTTTHSDPKSCREKFRHYAKKVIDWPGFDFTMGIVILVNAVLIGFEIDLSIANEEAFLLNLLFGLDYLFLTIYILELTFRFLAGGPSILRNAWIRFDLVLVLLGISAGILSVISLAVLDAGVSGVRDFLDKIIILRILRLCRMVRAIRMFGKWHTLWKLVQGVMNGVETLGSTMVMLFFSIYVFACVGAEFLARDEKLQNNELTKVIIEENFSSLPMIFLTLLQFVLVDGVSDIYLPFIRVQPGLAVYFGALISFLSILLANLVTAVLVDDAIQNSQLDERIKHDETKKTFERMIPKLKEAFAFIDRDRGGFVLKEEFLNADFSKRADLEEVAALLTPAKKHELYDHLDADDSGIITEEELIDGVMKLKLTETTLEIAQIKTLVTKQKRSLRAIRAAVDKVSLMLEDAAMAPMGRFPSASGNRALLGCYSGDSTLLLCGLSARMTGPKHSSKFMPPKEGDVDWADL